MMIAYTTSRTVRCQRHPKHQKHQKHQLSKLNRRLTLLHLLLPIILLSSYCSRCNGHPSSTATISTSTNTNTYRQQKTHLQSLPKVAPLLGESAIIDKESGRVYWQGGEQSLIHSIIGHTYFQNKSGLARHVRSTFYSCILWMSVIRFIAIRMLDTIDSYLGSWSNGSNDNSIKNGKSDNTKIIEVITTAAAAAALSAATTTSTSSQRIRNATKQMTKVLRIFLICVAYLPKFNKKFLYIIGLFYLIESYTCSTRKYLDNVSSPEDVETYLEAMKEQKPYVKWEIRCFHYERRKILCMLLMIDVWTFLYKLIAKKGNNNKNNIHEQVGEEEELSLRPSILTKKVVTYQTSQYYKFNSWEDETIGGIWKQPEAATSINSDFTKISMYKLLLFANSKARADYFVQQQKFVNEEGGQKDTFAELSTKVQVEGYRKKILVVKRTNGLLRKIFKIQFYWLFTFLLLTVPFRVNFARYCDELHITLAKETSTEIKKDLKLLPSTHSRSSWFPSPKSWFTGVSSSSSIEGQSSNTNSNIEVEEIGGQLNLPTSIDYDKNENEGINEQATTSTDTYHQ